MFAHVCGCVVRECACVVRSNGMAGDLLIELRPLTERDWDGIADQYRPCLHIAAATLQAATKPLNSIIGMFGGNVRLCCQAVACRLACRLPSAKSLDQWRVVSVLAFVAPMPTGFTHSPRVTVARCSLCTVSRHGARARQMCGSPSGLPKCCLARARGSLRYFWGAPPLLHLCGRSGCCVVFLGGAAVGRGGVADGALCCMGRLRLRALPLPLEGPTLVPGSILCA